MPRQTEFLTALSFCAGYAMDADEVALKKSDWPQQWRDDEAAFAIAHR